jgi:hypothetical protein
VTTRWDHSNVVALQRELSRVVGEAEALALSGSMRFLWSMAKASRLVDAIVRKGGRPEKVSMSTIETLRRQLVLLAEQVSVAQALCGTWNRPAVPSLRRRRWRW